MKQIILGSASPRRKELLAQIGLPFRVLVSHAEERITTSVPHQVVEELSCQKAEAVWKLLEEQDACEDALVIGADTVVAAGGRILGKPTDRQDAKRMLRLLQGSRHQVYTGVTIRTAETVKTFSECTEVEFYPMSDEEIDFYADTGEPDDKAGAYGIQGICARFIKGIDGDYTNVVGLPIGRLYQELKGMI